MSRAVSVLSASFAVVCLAGCSAPTSSDPEFDVTFTASPDPTIATRSSGVTYKVTNSDDTISTYEYMYRASFSVNVKDNAGMPLDIASINLTCQQATGGIVITPSGGDQLYFRFNSSAVTNHINENGSADVGFDVWYTLPSRGKEALLTVAFTFSYTDSDDNTYNYSKTGTVKVAP